VPGGVQLRTYVVVVAMAFAAEAVHAAPPDYTIRKVAHEGDPAPSGGTITQLYGDASIDDAGRVAFEANDSGTAQVLLLFDGTTVTDGVREGDVAPDTGGATVLAPISGRVAAPEFLGYAAIYSGAGPPSGAFRTDGTVGAAVLQSGASAPGGGTLLEADTLHDVNEAGLLAFGGTIDPGVGGAVTAHFVGTPAAVSVVYREGGATPVGGTFTGVETFHATALAADGSLAFVAKVAGGAASSGLFRWSAGVAVPLLVADALLPGDLGVLEAFGSSTGSNEQGDIAFNADVLLPGAPFATEGIYVLESGVVRLVIRRDEAISGTNPVLYFQGLLGSTAPDPSANGITVFTALVEDASFQPQGAVIAEHGGATRIVSLTGRAVPGVPGSVFTDYSDARINSAGEIVFTASTSTGTGVFVARPRSSVPGLAPLGVAMTASAMALLAGWSLSRRTTPDLG
jgi:hypothetical protein